MIISIIFGIAFVFYLIKVGVITPFLVLLSEDYWYYQKTFEKDIVFLVLFFTLTIFAILAEYFGIIRWEMLI